MPAAAAAELSLAGKIRWKRLSPIGSLPLCFSLGQIAEVARDMIEQYRQRHGCLPQTLATDTPYGNGELLQWLDERGIATHIRVEENPNGQLISITSTSSPTCPRRTAISAPRTSLSNTLASIRSIAITFIIRR
jgi:hypothetical protein